MNVACRKLKGRRQFLRMAGLAGIAGAFPLPSAWSTEPHPTRSPLNNLSDADEIALGDIFAERLDKQLPLVDSALIDGYLDNMVQKLAKVSQRPDLPYKCKLVNEDVLNAFSIAGGRIYIYRGLVDNLQKEDELVATISHEIGHVVGRHSANQMMLQFRARQAYELVKKNIPEHAELIDTFIEKLGGPVALLAMMHFSRQDEFEADMLGFYETIRADWSPNGFLTLFAMFEGLEKKSPDLPLPVLRDHPPSDERAAAIQKELGSVTLSNDASTDSLQFHAFRLAMNLLPDPPKKGDPL